MKLNKISLALLGAIALGSTAVQAASQGAGKVTFVGSIIDAPCSLSAKSVDQTIEMGQVSNKVLANGGQAVARNFNIELEQCDISTLKKVQVTFGGDADVTDPSLLGIAGSARGAGIALANGAGSQVKLGEASPARTLLEGNNTLVFGAYLKGTTAKDVAVTPGEFNAVANFVLAYQ